MTKVVQRYCIKRCIVPTCFATFGDTKNTDLLFFFLPLDQEKRQRWFQAIGRAYPYRIDTEVDFLCCSKHFKPSDIVSMSGGATIIKENVLPSVLLSATADEQVEIKADPDAEDEINDSLTNLVTKGLVFITKATEKDTPTFTQVRSFATQTDIAIRPAAKPDGAASTDPLVSASARFQHKYNQKELHVRDATAQTTLSNYRSSAPGSFIGYLIAKTQRIDLKLKTGEVSQITKKGENCFLVPKALLASLRAGKKPETTASTNGTDAEPLDPPETKEEPPDEDDMPAAPQASAIAHVPIILNAFSLSDPNSVTIAPAIAIQLSQPLQDTAGLIQIPEPEIKTEPGDIESSIPQTVIMPPSSSLAAAAKQEPMEEEAAADAAALVSAPPMPVLQPAPAAVRVAPKPAAATGAGQPQKKFRCTICKVILVYEELVDHYNTHKATSGQNGDAAGEGSGIVAAKRRREM